MIDISKINITFIVGLPRSGTTILYNSIAKHSDLAFFEKSTRNPNPDTWKFPRYTGLFSKPKPHPLEGGVWRRFYNELEYVTKAIDKHKIYHDKAIEMTCNAFKKNNFLSKNPSHCLRIRWLLSMYPNARFIILHRKRNATIESLLHYAKKNWQRDFKKSGSAGYFEDDIDFQGWVTINMRFGGTPKKLSEKAIMNYHDYMKRMQIKDSEYIPDCQKYNVSYELFCENSQYSINKIFEFMKLPPQKIRLGEISNMNFRHSMKST